MTIKLLTDSNHGKGYWYVVRTRPFDFINDIGLMTSIDDNPQKINFPNSQWELMSHFSAILVMATLEKNTGSSMTI